MILRGNFFTTHSSPSLPVKKINFFLMICISWESYPDATLQRVEIRRNSGAYVPALVTSCVTGLLVYLIHFEIRCVEIFSVYTGCHRHCKYFILQEFSEVHFCSEMIKKYLEHINKKSNTFCNFAVLQKVIKRCNIRSIRGHYYMCFQYIQRYETNKLV